MPIVELYSIRALYGRALVYADIGDEATSYLSVVIPDGASTDLERAPRFGTMDQAQWHAWMAAVELNVPKQREAG